jgi:protein-disulfide isomerase
MTETNMRRAILGGIVLLMVLIVGGLIWAIAAGPGPARGPGQPETGLTFNDANNPSKGPADAKLTVHIFGDLQCPACRAAEPGLRYAMQKYADKVRFVWTDFPLMQAHQNARAAATAARCAEDQGKFWEFHDTLYDNQQDWAGLTPPTSQFVSYAKTLGLDADKFSTCLANDTDRQKIEDDMSEGGSDSIQATPTFFIGNVRYEGGMTNDQWDQRITAGLSGASS